MKKTDTDERLSGYILGKEFLIVIVVVFSALSFTLGYFVGKNNNEKNLEVALPATETAARNQIQTNIPRTNNQSVEQIPQVQSNIPATEISKSDNTNLILDTRANTPQSEQHSKSSDVKNNTSDTNSVTETQPSKKGKQTVHSETQQYVKKDEHEKVSMYSVQIGAFKNLAEAEKFKSRYEKKGIKTFITVISKKSGKIYKVKSGEFNSRKEAEVYALKLSKTEGLKPFVTLKNE